MTSSTNFYVNRGWNNNLKIEYFLFQSILLNQNKSVTVTRTSSKLSYQLNKLEAPHSPQNPRQLLQTQQKIVKHTLKMSRIQVGSIRWQSCVDDVMYSRDSFAGFTIVTNSRCYSRCDGHSGSFSDDSSRWRSWRHSSIDQSRAVAVRSILQVGNGTVGTYFVIYLNKGRLKDFVY